ncbi:hypothetical protein Aab01nite_16550 [Paractinoplanes abujensis]|uniref:DUF2029 domain-containing protein n=1 Tax=Paractinoplanes abujensis TaxID=882441 RepID=A0A7W7D1A2_9ACTN|nr:hypothetical protein [Actinoplanes abujensis]MBB4697460.1 hypothetical protein [Actinoplanes abujensis]GID18065.1 hypothetical protein Aab01nite_16550 [Actinoplanes abujensis]
MTTTLLDRVVHWNLDLDGDTYGDERERYRWYEGIAAAASMQWMVVPWAAAVMVWPLGRSSVIPLAVVLVAMMVPITICGWYVRSRRVDTTPRSWGPRRVVLTLIGGLPYAVFLVGALRAYDPDGATWVGAAIGGAFGGVFGLVSQVRQSRRRRRLEDSAVDDD